MSLDLRDWCMDWTFLTILSNSEEEIWKDFVNHMVAFAFLLEFVFFFSSIEDVARKMGPVEFIQRNCFLPVYPAMTYGVRSVS